MLESSQSGRMAHALVAFEKKKNKNLSPYRNINR